MALSHLQEQLLTFPMETELIGGGFRALGRWEHPIIFFFFFKIFAWKKMKKVEHRAWFA